MFSFKHRYIHILSIADHVLMLSFFLIRNDNLLMGESVDERMEIHVVKAFVTSEKLSLPSLHIASMSYFIRGAEPNLCGT